MAQFSPDWAEQQRKRWMRPNAHLYIRPDAYRFMPPGAPRYDGKDAVKYFWPEAETDDFARHDDAEAAVLQHELDAIRRDFEALRREWLARKAGFNPGQPRVPAGNPDGGQFTRESDSANRVRLASSDKPILGPRTILTIAAELARRAIEAYRSENGLRDLFGSKVGTVTVTTINGEGIFGSNSTSPTYTLRDLAEAKNLREKLLEKYPDVMETENIGRRPNDAIFHAETTVLLRAARANGGSLAGKSIEVHSDRGMCPSCEKVLPLVGLELGNPTVTFVEPTGLRKTMQDGSWAARRFE